MKRIRQIAGIVVAIALLWSAHVNVAFSQAEVSARIEGELVPDVENGLQGMILVGDTVRFVIMAKSDVNQVGATLGFIFYSPDSSMSAISTYNYTMSLKWGDAATGYWNLGGGAWTQNTDGVLPEQFLTGGAALPNAGFQEDTLVDIFTVDVATLEGGVLCFDSAFFPPAGQWLMSVAGNDSKPLWYGGSGDLSVGGTHPNAFCITVASTDCCFIPGDADHSGSANIADVTFMIARIFSGGPAPICINEADANGHGGFNIADVAFMTKWMFRGGFPPTCPANSN